MAMNRDSVVSTKVKADREKVGSVLGKYDLEGVEFRFDGAGRLEAVGPESEEDGLWPRAVLAAECSGRAEDDDEDDDDEDDDFDELYYPYDEKGSEGFVALLRELAGCIEAPMTVLAVSHDFDSNWSNSCVWRVEPGGTVEELSAAAYGG
jgi:hypothetical protein